MNEQETTKFELWALTQGYSIKKERGRYCQGVVNELKKAWKASSHQALPVAAMARASN